MGPELTSLEFWEHSGKKDLGLYCEAHGAAPVTVWRRWGRGKGWLMCCLFHQATNEVIGRVPQSTKAEMDAAVSSCKRTFPAWADTSVLSRQQVLLRYQQLIKENLVRKLNGIISQSVI